MYMAHVAVVNLNYALENDYKPLHYIHTLFGHTHIPTYILMNIV